MGSYYTTCFVSHTPIKNNDKVRLFFIKSNRKTYNVDLGRESLMNNLATSIWADFKIIGGVGIPAVYNDQNCYTFDYQSVYALNILNYIKKKIAVYSPEYLQRIKEQHLFEPKIHNILYDSLNFKKIQKLISEGELFLNSDFNKEAYDFVQVMAIHEDIYQIMINEDSIIFDITQKDHYKKVTKDYFILKALERYNLHYEEINKVVENVQVYFTEKNYCVGDRSLFDATLKEQLKEHKQVSDHDIVINLAENEYFFKKMAEHNIMIRPPVLSNQDDYAQETALLYRKIADTVLNNNKGHCEDFILTKKNARYWQELSVSEIEQLFTNLRYSKTEEEYLSLKQFQTKYKEQDQVLIDHSKLQEPEFSFLKNILENKSIDVVVFIHS